MAEKIYCTKCGREIKDGLLYCDRCGQSVKKSMERQVPKTNNRAEAERIHREQLERKKRRKEKEIKKQKKRRKAIKNTRLIAAFAGVLILAIVIIAVTYHSTIVDKPIMNRDDEINDEIAKNSPAVTDQTVTSSTISGDISFKMYKYNNISYPYPADFSPQSASEPELLHVYDPSGGANMTISHAAAADSSANAARALMTQYYDEVKPLGEIEDNRFGSNWYIVTYTSNGIVHHRKCVITGGETVYYDFEYASNSARASDYAACIEKLDNNFIAESDTPQ